jgi:hypothetical protein
LLDKSKLFHIGIVVPDVDATAGELGATGVQSFHPPIESARSVKTPSGPIDVRFRVRYSFGPFRLELVQEVPGTIWVASAGLHHLGYWAADLDSQSAALEDEGFPMVARSDAWSYHRSSAGFYVELLDEGRRPEMEERWRKAEALVEGSGSAG